MLELSPGCAAELGISPVSGPELAARVFVLGSLEPIDVGDHPRAVRFGIGGGENHGLKPDRVGAVELLRAEPAEKRQCPLDGRASRLSRRR